MNCPKCGKKTLLNWTKCPSCGYDVSEIYKNLQQAREIQNESNLNEQKSETTKFKGDSLFTIDALLIKMRIIGLCWFAIILIISIIFFINGNNLSETTTYIHFPFYVWKIARAIWWLLLSFAGLLVALVSFIAEISILKDKK